MVLAAEYKVIKGATVDFPRSQTGYHKSETEFSAFEMMPLRNGPIIRCNVNLTTYSHFSLDPIFWKRES